MRKLKVLLALALLGATVSATFADQRTVQSPSNRNGQEAHPWAAGGRVHRHTLVTQTNPVDGPVVIQGVLLFNTGAAPGSGAYVEYRDTSNTDGTVNVVARIRFDYNTGGVFQRLPFPLFLESGFAVSLSANSNGEEVYTVYTDVRDAN